MKPQESKQRVHCLGVAVVDALSGPLERYPVPRVETQVTTERVTFLAGGGAVNSASALARMGFRVGVYSKVGNDPMGAFLLRELEHCGADVSGVAVSPGETTPFTFVGIHPEGERTFIHTPGANKTLSIDDLDLDRLLDAEYLLYQDLWAMPSLDGRSAAEILAAARRKGLVTLLDECWGLGPRKDILEATLPHCDYVLPSFDDLEPLFPHASPETVAGELLTLGAGAVGLKLGPRGCLLARGRERTTIAAYPANVVDVTGAGDCWDAGFIAGLIEGEDPVAAARLANACAAFGIEAIGGSSGVPGFAAVRCRATG